MSETARFTAAIALVAAAPVSALTALYERCSDLPRTLDADVLAQDLDARIQQLTGQLPVDDTAGLADARLQALEENTFLVTATGHAEQVKQLAARAATTPDGLDPEQLRADVDELIDRCLADVTHLQRRVTAEILEDTLQQLHWTVDVATGQEHTVMCATAGDRAMDLVVGPEGVLVDVNGCDGPSCHDHVMDVFTAAHDRGLRVTRYRTTFPEDRDAGVLLPTPERADVAAPRARRMLASLEDRSQRSARRRRRRNSTRLARRQTQ